MFSNTYFVVYFSAFEIIHNKFSWVYLSIMKMYESAGDYNYNYLFVRPSRCAV